MFTHEDEIKKLLDLVQEHTDPMALLQLNTLAIRYNSKKLLVISKRLFFHYFCDYVIFKPNSFFWEEIYDSLIEYAKAPESLKEEFVLYMKEDTFPKEFRFQGKLGFGGKCYASSNRRIWVSCYSEDETPEMTELIKVVNLAISLVSPFMDEVGVPKSEYQELFSEIPNLTKFDKIPEDSAVKLVNLPSK